MDLPLEVNPITVLVNNTNPQALLTRICDTLTTNRVHGVVFEDNVGSEAVAQILDFISTQTAVPIVGISGGSAVVLPYKVSVGAGTGEGLWGFRSSLTDGQDMLLDSDQCLAILFTVNLLIPCCVKYRKTRSNIQAAWNYE